MTCQNQLLSDLAFISVLSGNDYLPKLRGFNLERVWDAYLDARAKNLFAPEVPLYGTQRAADDYAARAPRKLSLGLMPCHVVALP